MYIYSTLKSLLIPPFLDSLSILATSEMPAVHAFVFIFVNFYNLFQVMHITVILTTTFFLFSFFNKYHRQVLFTPSIPRQSFHSSNKWDACGSCYLSSLTTCCKWGILLWFLQLHFFSSSFNKHSRQVLFIPSIFFLQNPKKLKMLKSIACQY